MGVWPHRLGVCVLVAEQFVAFPVLVSIMPPEAPPPAAILAPVILNDILMIVAVAALRRAEFRQVAVEAALREKNKELQVTLAEVKELRGLLPICAW